MDYDHPLAGRVVVRRDCVETTNQSRARFAGGITLDDFEPAPKNPLIANFFTQIGRAEDLGNGTRNLYKYAPTYGGRDPELADGDMFTARVWTTFAGAGQMKGASPLDAELLETVSRYQPARSADIVAAASASERSVKRHLARLVSSGLLLAEVTTGDRRYRLP